MQNKNNIVNNPANVNRQIIIKKSYFNNIETAIEAINGFFSSNFKNKDFPVNDGDYDVDESIMKIVGLLDSVEPSWVDDPSVVERTIDAINDVADRYPDSNNKYEDICNANDNITVDHINAFISFKALQSIADHFPEFSKLINGIYSVELFTKPSNYKREIELFSEDIDLKEIKSISEDIHNAIFDPKVYVESLFNSSQITMPKDMNSDNEIKRMMSYQDLPTNNTKIVVDESETETTEDISSDKKEEFKQEAAKVNYFENFKPIHIKYSEKGDKFVVSQQFKKSITTLIEGLEKCDTSKDLMKLFESYNKKEPDYFTSNVIPFILAKVFNNTKKYPNQNFDTDALANYINSYKSIADKNVGSRRFINYDLFSTFKIDKDGTIKFLKDFLNIELYNDKNVVITNNTLLTLFNIFDSRIYFDILYNLIPENVKKNKYPSEDEFVKKIRARINKNSRASNVYQKQNNPPDGTNIPTGTEVVEYVNSMLKQYGDMDISDRMYCEQFIDVLRNEINTINYRMYRESVSPIYVADYIESHMLTEAYDGSIPEYMKTRVQISDDAGDNTSSGSKVTMTDVQLPPDIPQNPVPDLVDSIEERADYDSNNLADSFGARAKVKEGNNSNIVYNITNNYSYHDSFNKTKTVNDLSSQKNASHNNSDNTKISNDLSTKNHSDRRDSHNNNSVRNDNSMRTYYGSDRGWDNNYNNSISSDDTKGSKHIKPEDFQEFSTGYTVESLFDILESSEPLSTFTEAKAPKEDLLTTAMDADRKTLSLQQEAKKKVQKGLNTGKAILKPVTRTKQWIAGIVDSCVQRDEDKVKAEIIENPSYRTAICKAARLAAKLGMFGVLFTLNGYLGAVYAGYQGFRAADKERLKKEIQSQFATELEIMDDKIEKADEAGDNKAKWEMMRQRKQIERIIADTTKAKVKHPKSIA